ncbi:MAG: hypothetical protein ACJAXS_001934 [Colwellia sp.]|jgi:hypothetical protein
MYRLCAALESVFIRADLKFEIFLGFMLLVEKIRTKMLLRAEIIDCIRFH